MATPLLPLSVNGAGDATSALFLAHYLMTGDPAQALSRVAASIFAVLEETHRVGAREIRLIAMQNAIAEPDERFEVVKVR